MGYTLVLIASLLGALGNLFFRRAIDAGGRSRPYIVVQLFTGALMAVLINPVRTGLYHFELPSFWLGLIGGLALALMMYSLGRALERGPPGLTFAALNSASVVPAIWMALLFGLSFGHPYTIWNGVGSFLVVVGLFWAGWEVPRTPEKFSWGSYTLIAFLMHGVLFALLQWRALMLVPHETSWRLPFFLDPLRGEWFLPILLGVAGLFHLILLLRGQPQVKWAEASYGLLGGLANGGYTFLLVWAAEVATPVENAMLFPIFAVSVILFTNLWGQFLYKERVHWAAISLALVGLLIGT